MTSSRGPEQPRRDEGLRPVTVLLTAAGTLVLGYLLLRYVNDHMGRIPFPSWLGIAAVVILGAVVVVAGWPIRRWRVGKLDRRLDPLRAFRTLVLARAAALAGGAVVGWYGAHALVLAPEAESETVMRGIGWSLGHVAAGCALVACGLVVQSWCRLDPPDDDPDLDAPPR